MTLLFGVLAVWVFSSPCIASGTDRDARDRLRSVRRQALQKQLERNARRDVMRDARRLNAKLPAEESKISDARVTDQKYLAAEIRKVQAERKAREKLVTPAELAHIRRARAEREQEARITERKAEQRRKKKKKNMF